MPSADAIAAAAMLPLMLFAAELLFSLRCCHTPFFASACRRLIKKDALRRHATADYMPAALRRC